MVKLSAFADEISKDLDEQMAALVRNGVEYVELRGVWGKNVLELASREIRDVRSAADAEGIGFSAIGSPLGKYPLDGDFDEQIEGVRRALEYAQVLDAPYIRIFSYYIPDGDDPPEHREQVIDWLGRLIGEVEDTSVKLAHENESRIYGDTGERCADLMTSLGGDSFVTAFDFANFVQCGERPYEDCWPKLRDRVAYFHIKDVDRASSRVVPAGQGDGDVERILGEAFSAGFDGYLSLEPHLKEEFGATGAERFRAAVEGIRGVLGRIGPSHGG